MQLRKEAVKCGVDFWCVMAIIIYSKHNRKGRYAEGCTR